jgi:hypothetical protein
MLGSYIRRRVSVIACALAAAALGVEFSLFGQSARATDPDPATEVNLLSCTGTQATSFNPGLTLIPRQTTFNAVGSLSPCVSLGSTINSGNYQRTDTASLSCLLDSEGPATYTYHWNNGKFSTVRYELTGRARPAGQAVFTFSGTVQSGEYAGARATMTLTLVTTQATGCLTPEGATSNSGVVTVTFAGPLNL